MQEYSLLFQVSIFLLSACIAVIVAQKFKMSSVLGYLVAGVLLGPGFLNIVKDPGKILHISEFGVVLFMFLIGLEINIKRLWNLRKHIFGLGFLQVLTCTLVLFFIFNLFKLGNTASLIAAFGVSLSSTAIVMQILQEKNASNKNIKNSVFSIVLFQDLAVIPVLVLLPLLSLSAAEKNSLEISQNLPQWVKFVLVFGAIGVMIFLGRAITRPIFRRIAQTRVTEVFTAFSLFIVVGVSYGMEKAGISMALGAFVAGVVLSDSEYRHELEAHIQPFKGLLLGLFFLSVGMTLQLDIIANSYIFVLSILALILVVKIVSVSLLSKIFKLSITESIWSGIILSQCGEFCFVLFGTAQKLNLINESQISLLNGVVVLSMMTTSILVLFYEKILSFKIVQKFLNSRIIVQNDYETPQNEEAPVIVAGFGRFGQIVTRLLHANGIKTTLIDQSVDIVESVRKFSFKTYYGDASRRDILEAAGIAHARAVVLAIDDKEKSVAIAKEIKEFYPNVYIVPRAFDMLHAYEFLDIGITSFERETFDSALSVGVKILKHLGFDPLQAQQSALKFKEFDEKNLKSLYKSRKDEALYLSRALEAREEIERVFISEGEKISQNVNDTEWGT
jgi:glutathione-regulated potassium-efflux system ancillary protein KefC